VIHHVSRRPDAPSFETARRRAGQRGGRGEPRTGSAIAPAIALLPLRLFLGITFVYAGIQKLSDAGFLHPGSPTYIGTQLSGFANHTPGGFILRTFAIPHAELAGVSVAIVEILIGLLATFGLYTRAAAACGMALNFLLFLTASWHTTPYFLGPDIVFTFAWLPFVLVGATGQPALDNAILQPSEALVRRTTLRSAGDRPGGAGPLLTRRTLLAEMAGGALALAGISALLKGSYTAPTLARGSSSSASGGRPAAGGGSRSAPANAASSLPANAVKLGRSNQIAAGNAAEYSDPADGSPDILIRESDGSLRAFSAVCTHAGCTVSFQNGEIICPCHGGVYSAQTGQVVSGPPPAGLPPKHVIERRGQIYALPS
jgi:thiosulfate dehydrogenase (quinone) large subunit